jgi:ribonuclease HI
MSEEEELNGRKLALMNEVTIYFDGSCGPKNPGGTAKAAWLLYDVDKNLIAKECQVVCSGPTATNNIGEWAGLTNALRYIVANKLEHGSKINIKGDSQLVIYQLTGEYKCRKDTLKPYYEECLALLGNYGWQANWIAREENQEADTLSK